MKDVKINDDYTKVLEKLVICLAGAYEQCKKKYYTKHLETVDFHNPDKRKLTDAEDKEMMTFPFIGGIARFTVEEISKIADKDNLADSIKNILIKNRHINE